MELDFSSTLKAEEGVEYCSLRLYEGKAEILHNLAQY